MAKSINLAALAQFSNFSSHAIIQYSKLKSYWWTMRCTFLAQPNCQSNKLIVHVCVFVLHLSSVPQEFHNFHFSKTVSPNHFGFTGDAHWLNLYQFIGHVPVTFGVFRIFSSVLELFFQNKLFQLFELLLQIAKWHF